MNKATRKPRGPSAGSLRAMPEHDFSAAKANYGRGPEAIARALAWSRANAGLGRPRKGEPRVPTKTRSVRFSEVIWTELERQAKKRRIPLHALLREIIVGWLSTEAHVGSGEKRAADALR